jgi:hypothetical protein
MTGEEFPYHGKKGGNLAICVKCGNQNPPGSNYCEACATPMPKVEYFQYFEPTIVRDRLDKIQAQIDNVQKEEITIQEFADFISVTYQELQQKGQEIQELVDSSDYCEISPEEVDIGYQGMQQYESGLQEMYVYVEDMDPCHLTQGMELMVDGNAKINNAMRINRENREIDGVVGTL